jgi:2-polyprenyl-6-methoxyphenol hydroxylase-like FAD-dependent oxidoreductase
MLRAVVVGAGPTGSCLALQLARTGWDVTLVEAAAPGGPRPYRGEGLMPSGLEALEGMGLWPLPAGVRHRPLRGWAVVLERRPFFDVLEPLGADRGCWLVDQETLLEHLRLELGGQSGIQLLEGRAVRGLWRPTGPLGRVEGVVFADGEEVGADLVVGADGRHSLVRQLGALELQQEVAGEEVLWFRLAGPDVAALEQWLGGRFLTVVQGGLSFALFQEAAGEALRLGWVAEGNVGRPEQTAGWRQRWCDALPEEAAALLRQVPDPAISGPQRLPVRVGRAPCWHAPGLLLLGDAAHPMSPVRAQGLNMALRDALLTARLLAPLPQGSTGSPAARIDALLPLIARQRLPEIRLMQELQAREAGLGALLRQQGWLRWGLARTAPWSGVGARLRWIQQQHRLRQGLPGALVLPK